MWRADREHIPLLTAQATRNFTANGQPGLPVCGICLLAAQALPMAALPCEGRALVVHSNDPGLILAFAREYVEDKTKLCALALGSGSDKIPHVRHPRTRLIDAMTKAQERQQLTATAGPTPSVSLYHFTNSGQAAAITLHHIPSEVVGFVHEAQSRARRNAWHALAETAWEIPPERKRKGGDDTLQAWNRRNYLYEDLFSLPEMLPASSGPTCCAAGRPAGRTLSTVGDGHGTGADRPDPGARRPAGRADPAGG